MPLFMIQGTYTPEAWAAQIRNPVNRLEQLREMAAQLNGQIIDAWHAFGEYDIYMLVDSPSNVDMAGMVLSAYAGGALRAVKTTPLLSIADGVEAMRRAQQVPYTPPSAN